MNERLVCLDIGDVRIGVAVSDLTRTIATPVEVITRVGFGPDVRKIAAICDRYETKEILSGLPLNMDGTEGFQAQKVKLLCEQLEKAGFIVYYQDERLTTVTAENALMEDGMHRADRKKNVDKVAAAIILQQYLDTLAQQSQIKEDTPMAENNEEFIDLEDEDSIIELIDENGETVPFQFLMPIEHEGKQYMSLMPLNDDEDDEDDDGAVVILEVTTDDKGEECYVGIDNEELLQKLYDILLEQLAEEEEE